MHTRERPPQRMRTKLVLYMLILSLLLLLLLSVLLYLSGHFQTPRNTLAEKLLTQSATLEKELVTHRENLCMLGTRLSDDATVLITAFLDQNDLTFDALRASEEYLTDLQGQLIGPLQQYLLQANCSGAFVILDTTVSSTPDTSSKSGLYLQVNGYETDRREMILYRGYSSVAKQNDIMPHRQWRLEINSEDLPLWPELQRSHRALLFEDCRFTDVVTLPGTSEKAFLVLLPIVGRSGENLGVCGFEISESYFKRTHSQYTTLTHFTGLMTTDSGDGIDSYLVCGSDSGYFNDTTGSFSVRDYGDGLSELFDGKTAYLGIVRTYQGDLPGESFVSVVMTPKADYRHDAIANGVRITMLILLLGVLTVCFCVYFSRRYLSPVLHALEQIKREDRKQLHSQLSEINDLLAFLAEQDDDRQAVLENLTQEMNQARLELSELQAEQEVAKEKYDHARQQISRLALPGGTAEINETEYEQFVRGIQKLTPREREIFDLYLQGKTGVEIRDILGITENTLKYHNRNIYGTLNVRSKKQLLRYASILEERGTPPPEEVPS